jgi:hypothetical protein
MIIEQTHTGDNLITISPPYRNNRSPCPIENPTHNPHLLQRKKGLRKKANIKIATLNINSLHTNTDTHHNFEKWSEINTVMRKQSIAILALQETHMDEQWIIEIQNTFKKRLLIENTKNEHVL